MIERALFKSQMAILADRLKSTLTGSTQVEYWRQLSTAMTTEQFLAAMTLLIATWDAKFKTWPSPLQIVETIRPIAAPSLSALEAFEKVIDLMTDPRESLADRRAKVQALGASTMRAFLAAGGARSFANVLEADVQWLRKPFVAAYEDACAHADAEQAAHVALGDADQRLQLMAASLAQQKAMPSAAPAAKRIAG